VHDGLWFHLSTPADLSEAESVLHLRREGEPPGGAPRGSPGGSPGRSPGGSP
jgi:hypothetical protein